MQNRLLLLAVVGLMSCSFSGTQFFHESNGTEEPPPTPTPSEVATVSVNDLLERQSRIPTPTVETTAEVDPALAAQVNGEPILLASYEQRATRLESSLQAQGLDPNSAAGQDRLAKLKQQLLDGLIEQKIIEQQARQFGLTVTNIEVEAQAESVRTQMSEDQFELWLADNGLTYDSFLTDLRAELLAGKLFDQVTRNTPTHAEQVLLRLIQVDDQATAQEIVERLKAGVSFETQAQTHSQDESSRIRGGTLGWLPAGANVVPGEVEEVAFSMQPGDIGGPIATSYGFYIIKVDDRAADRELTESQCQQLNKQIFDDWLRQQRATANIERFINM